MALIYENITQLIIGAAFEVHRMLGYGFLEKVYQKAMQVELSRNGLQTDLEQPIKVYFKGVIVGDYYADLVVDNKVIVELKVANKYRPQDEAQLLNELKATGMEVGVLINFGRQKVEFKRFASTNQSAYIRG